MRSNHSLRWWDIAVFTGFIVALIASQGCGVAATDYVRPAYQATIEVCRQKQVSAVEHAESREQAEADVATIRNRCSVAYAGLEASARLLDEALPTEDNSHE